MQLLKGLSAWEWVGMTGTLLEGRHREGVATSAWMREEMRVVGRRRDAVVIPDEEGPPRFAQFLFRLDVDNADLGELLRAI